MKNDFFDEKLKEIRIKSKKTVPEVSKYLTSLGHKASEKTIYSWESGRSRPTIDIFLDMCKFYGLADVMSKFQDMPELDNVFSQAELEHIKKYRSLDPYGKEAVDVVLDVEWRRCEAARQSKITIQDQQSKMEAAEENVFYSVPGYSVPMSAGSGQPAGHEEHPEDYRLTKKPPRGTSFIAPVKGISMEPTYHDGDLVFVYATEEIRVGQIGAFLMDGEQWIKELGDGVLISHNPGYEPITMIDGTRCQGLVLGVCDESYFE